MIQHVDGVEFLTTLEEAEFKMRIDACIRIYVNCIFLNGKYVVNPKLKRIKQKEP